jgi:toxin ParE1/3/4
MGRVLRSPQSNLDVWEIADYIAQHNVSAAADLLREFDESLKLLSDFPGMGARRDELLRGLRSYPIGNYILFYRLAPDGIELVRVVHGARDLDELF